jgi:hypothetical protein
MLMLMRANDIGKYPLTFAGIIECNISLETLLEHSAANLNRLLYIEAPSIDATFLTRILSISENQSSFSM